MPWLCQHIFKGENVEDVIAGVFDLGSYLLNYAEQIEAEEQVQELYPNLVLLLRRKRFVERGKGFQAWQLWRNGFLPMAADLSDLVRGSQGWSFCTNVEDIADLFRLEEIFEQETCKHQIFGVVRVNSKYFPQQDPGFSAILLILTGNEQQKIL